MSICPMTQEDCMVPLYFIRWLFTFAFNFENFGEKEIQSINLAT